MMDRKWFHLATFSSLCLRVTLKGQVKVTYFQWAVSQSKIDTWSLLIMDISYKSYMRFLLAPFYFLLILFVDDLKRSHQGHIFSMGCISETVQDIVTIKHG